MIQLTDIHLQFPQKVIFSGVNLTIDQGEIVGLVAPNGMGKTSFLNLLMAYLAPDQGKISLGKLDYQRKNLTKIYQQLTKMPDQDDLYEDLTGTEHLKLYQNMWKQSSREPKEIVELLKMGHFSNQKVKTYSLGMRQRLCFAMMLVANTPVMLLDELTNGLDVEHIQMVSQIILDLKSQGTTIVMVSHLLSNLETVADRIYFLKDGAFVHTWEKDTKAHTNRVLLFETKQAVDTIGKKVYTVNNQPEKYYFYPTEIEAEMAQVMDLQPSTISLQQLPLELLYEQIYHNETNA